MCKCPQFKRAEIEGFDEMCSDTWNTINPNKDAAFECSRGMFHVTLHISPDVEHR